MEKYKLTVRVHELKVGQVFWFSGGWRKVLDIQNGVLYYKAHTDRYTAAHQKNETLMAGSQMLVEIQECPK